MKELPREELTGWMAFWELEPFGSSFDEYRSALIASVVAEVNRNRKKRGRAFTPKEFMSDWGKDKDEGKAATPEEMLVFLQGFQNRMEEAAGVSPTQLVDQHGRPIGGGVS